MANKSKIDEYIQFIIPPLLVILLTVSIIQIFFDMGPFSLFIELLDLLVMIIFAVDLYYRWKETPQLLPYLKKHWIDIIATIPFNYIFLGVNYLVFTRGIKIITVVSKTAYIARFAKFFKFLKIGARLPRFLKIRHLVKPVTGKKVQPHEKEMKGILSFKVILLITINSIMGTGIFFLVSAGARYAGPASLISWVILSIISIYIAMCFSELTSMFPKAGGVYEFGKQAFGRFWSFILGWSTAIAGSVTISMLLLGALRYLLPIEYSIYYTPIAIGLILLFNYIAYRGLQTSTIMLVSFSIVTICTVLAVIIPGFFTFNPQNFTPFFVFPTINILLAIFFIAETFFGWESAVFLSAETKNPTKVMPRALILGTIIIAIFAFFLALTGMGAIPWDEFAKSSAPLRDLGTVYFGGVGTVIFTILVFTSIIGAVAAWIVTAPRLLMSIAEDKLFFVQFARIHPKYKSPYVSIIFQTILISTLVIIGAGSYETLLHLLIPLIIVVYSGVLLSVVILRFKEPNLARPYKAPIGKFGPILTIMFMGFLLYMFISETHNALDLIKISGFLITLGVPAYFFIEMFYEKEYIIGRINFFAKLSHHSSNIPFPRPLFNEIMHYIGPFTKNTVLLDYNCGTGSFLKKIIRDKKPYKKIFAFDNSKESLNLLRENIPEVHKNKIEVVYRESWKIPTKKVKGTNAFVSFNSLGYVKDIPQFLKHLNEILPKNGTFCFFINHNIVNVTPNALVVEDHKLVKNIFIKEGFDVHYIKKKKLFRERIFIYGTKL